MASHHTVRNLCMWAMLAVWLLGACQSGSSVNSTGAPPNSLATASPVALPTIATAATPPPATVYPQFSESDTKLTIPLPAGETVLNFTISPDRLFIVYLAGTGEGSPTTLASLPMDGGVPVRLGDMVWDGPGLPLNPTPDNQYTITADSRDVLFQRDDQLYRVPISGGAPQQLAAGLGGADLRGAADTDLIQNLHNEARDFREFPAGIVYRTIDALYFLPHDGGVAVKLSDPLASTDRIYGYDASADGRWLVYDVRRFVPWDTPKTPSWGSGVINTIVIYSVPLAGGTPIVLAAAPSDKASIVMYAFSQDGNVTYDGRELNYFINTNVMEGGEIDRFSVPLGGGTSTSLPTP